MTGTADALVYNISFINAKYRITEFLSVKKRISKGAFYLLVILIGFVGIALIFNVDPELVISTSTLVATAIGFASTSIATNLVGGLYLIITRPFGVGDFINAQGNEGIVIEIG